MLLTGKGCAHPCVNLTYAKVIAMVLIYSIWHTIISVLVPLMKSCSCRGHWRPAMSLEGASERDTARASARHTS